MGESCFPHLSVMICLELALVTLPLGERPLPNIPTSSSSALASPVPSRSEDTSGVWATAGLQAVVVVRRAGSWTSTDEPVVVVRVLTPRRLVPESFLLRLMAL